MDHFKLSNPRQLKRLNNSYNFLCQYYGQDTLNKDTEHNTDIEYGFPMLVTLSALEYVNDLEDKTLRDKLKSLLRGEEKFIDDTEVRKSDKGEKITHDVIQLSSGKLDPNAKKIFFEAIEPFVLPALEQADVTDKPQASSG